MSLFSRIKDIAAASFSKRDSYPFAMLFGKFQSILDKNNQALELMAGMGDKLGGDYVFDRQYILSVTQQLNDLVYKLIHDLNILAPKKYFDLFAVFEGISAQIQLELEGKWLPPDVGYVLSYELLNQDFSEEVGNKNAKLAEVRNILELPTPDGFAVTTRAFHSFMEWNRLREPVLELLGSWEQRDDNATEQIARGIQEQILQGGIPPDVSQQVLQSLQQLRHRSQTKDFCLAVRSSASAEDSAHSFAGQYKSFLNVAEKNLFSAYKKILASAYSGSVLEYRRQGGFLSHEIAMAVGCQVMVDAKASGVLYTMDPASPQREVMLISATWGLGAPVVEGKVQADQYVLERTPPHAVKALRIVPKTRLLVPAKGGGTEWSLAAEELVGKSCLNPEQLRTLAEMAVQIERYFKRPQDIEWALDQEGHFVILQVRPLNIRAQNQKGIGDISKVAEQYPVLLQGRGAVVQRGIGVGKVFVVKSEEDLLHFPHGAILVAPQTSPRLARVMRKAQGILTDVGSATGHMATVAREFRVPTVVNTGIATQILQAGTDVTLDATQNVVYAGIVKELCYYEYTAEEVFEESYEYRLLSRLLKRITPLKLLDPHDKNFMPSGCKTFHDIIRFIHEKAVEELIHIGYSRRRDTDKKARQLKFAIPLGLIVIDIGGGTEVAGNPSELAPEHITSIPMRAFLRGLLEPGMWSTEPVSVDFGSFMSSLTRTFSSSLATPQYVGQNLAVVSREYFDLSLRLGYHFNIVDAYITENLTDNYAYFRFLGGVTDPVRRSRRAKFIGEILERFNFRVEIRGDLVVGRIKKLARPQMEEKMWLIGCLVGYTRQLDIRMNSAEHVDQCVDDFMQRTAKQQEQTGSSEEVP